ncbi:TPA: hypothetical protein ACTW8Y_005287 [Raoultella ornithinolytica]|nr:hypothetical protein [Raoultella ornithinolytica]
MKNISDALKVSLGVAFIAEYNAEQVTPTNNVVIKLNFLASQCLNLQPEGLTNTIVGDVAKVFLMIKRIRKIYSIFTNQSGVNLNLHLKIQVNMLQHQVKIWLSCLRCFLSRYNSIGYLH